MNIVTEISEWIALKKKMQNKSIGFIPTMGHLHEGHLALCRRSKSENEITIVSIFVNPTQFNQTDDFDKYPRSISQDINTLSSCEIDYLFCPKAEDIYPDNYEIQVTESHISQILEGEHRPGHFNGMLTVVLKLLNLIQPTRAYFGEKDYQQLLLVKKMVKALFLPIEIVPCQTIRAEDGLALSSRNSRLNEDQRQRAADFPYHLKNARSTREAAEQLSSLGFRLDYVDEKWERRLGAVWLDDIRLIDNFSLKE
jgi:pantoate--beta-alanine ligase